MVSTVYQVSYIFDGGTAVVASYTSDTSGEVVVTGLEDGAYTDIFVTNSNCTSNVETETLSDPIPVVISTASTDPTTCSGTDGTITISGLVISTVYDISYIFDGGTAVVASYTSDALGEVVITGLEDGAYTGITATNSNCTSNVESVTLSDPSSAVIATAYTDPTTCSGSDGTITISGLMVSTTYAISYSFDGGTAVVASYTSDASGEVVITGLEDGAYTGITATNLGCTSNVESETLTDPIPAVITTDSTDPTTCDGTDGTITISGLLASTAYDISYSFDGGIAVVGNYTSDASGEVVITGLEDGAYTAITATNSNCTSNVETETLSDPSSAVITTDFTDPTTCSGADGTITISGLVASTAYDISYSLDGGAAVVGSYTSDASGEVVITGLEDGAYTAITATNSNCTSNVETETLSDPSSAVIATDFTDPTTCDGTDGTITISGLAVSTAYDISYSFDGGTAVVGSYTSDLSLIHISDPRDA